MAKTEKNDSIAMELTYAIGVKHFRQGNGDSAIAYIAKAANMAKTLGFFEIEFDWSISHAQAYSYIPNKPKALEIADSVIARSARKKDTLRIAWALVAKGDFYRRFGDFSAAIYTYEDAIEIAKTINSKLWIATALNNLSIINQKLGNEEKALELLLQSVKLREEINANSLGTSYANLANSYKRQEMFAEAVEWYNKSLKLLEGDAFVNNRIVCLRNLGDTYTRMGKYAKAKKLLNESYQLALKKDNVPVARAMYFLLTSTMYQNQQKHDSVIIQGLKVVDILTGNVEPFIRSSALLNVANAYYAKSGLEKNNRTINLNKAALYGEQAIEIAQETKSYEQINAVAKSLMKTYGLLGNADKTLNYTELYGASLDSLNKVEQTKNIVAMQTKFETEKKELEIELLNKDNELKDEKLNSSIEAQSKQKNLIVVVLVGLVISLFLVVLLVRQSSRRRTANEALSDRNKTITKQDQEKELLLKEIHHRVKNNLQVVSSLLQLQSNNVNEHERAALEEGQSRVRAMALIHEKLYQTNNVSEIDMKEYCVHLCRDITNVFGNKQTVKFNIEIENVLLDIDTAVPVGLMINELVTNAFKYAFKEQNGQMNIQICLQEPGIYKMIIADTGPGLPPELNWRKSKGLGLRLINLLTMQLYGTVDYDNSDLSTFTIIFKDTLERKKVA
ncbi:MAG: tetratricopeptide repeat-containing sensor histidine kinase [Bacteroidia bacterium]